jgi:hypothetical protein
MRRASLGGRLERPEARPRPGHAGDADEDRGFELISAERRRASHELILALLAGLHGPGWVEERRRAFVPGPGRQRRSMIPLAASSHRALESRSGSRGRDTTRAHHQTNRGASS